MILNIVSANMFFPLGKMIEMVWSQTSFILSNRSWEIGSLPTTYKQYRKNEIVLCRACISHAHLTYSYIFTKDPPHQCEHCQCILAVCNILVECNHFAHMYLKKGNIFGWRDVLEWCRFHPTLVLKHLWILIDIPDTFI